MGLLPCWRLTTPILPIVGGPTGAASGGNDLGGSVISEVSGEAHGQTIDRENKIGNAENKSWTNVGIADRLRA